VSDRVRPWPLLSGWLAGAGYMADWPTNETPAN